MTTLAYAWDRGAGDADNCAGRHDGNRGMAGAHRRASHDRRHASASCAALEPTSPAEAVRRLSGDGERHARVEPSSEISGSGHLEGMQHPNACIGEAAGSKFWFHALRNCFISVADRDLMLPASLTKRLVNHSRPQDVTEGYAADWTMEQLRDAAQRIADRIDTLIRDGMPAGAGLS